MFARVNSFGVQGLSGFAVAAEVPVTGVAGICAILYRLFGIPMGLNMFELYPFWYTFFTKLGFEVSGTVYVTVCEEK